MLHVVEVQLQSAFRLRLWFNDGTDGYVDLSTELDGPVFEPLRDELYFSQVAIDEELGTIAWPNGADFAPEFLQSRLQATSNPK